MTQEKKLTLISPVSVNYKLILEPQKTHKSDGEVSKGKHIYFRNGRAEVSEADFEAIKQVPGYGVDFVLETPGMKAPEPVAPTVATLGEEQQKEYQKGQLETLSKKVNMLVEAVAQIAETMSKKEKTKE